MALSAEVYTEAVTLAEYAKGLPDGLARTFVETFAKTSDLLGAMMIKPAVNGAFKFERIATLPTVAFRGLNEAGQSSSGTFTLDEEGIFYMDSYIQVDRALVDNYGMERRARQHELKAIAMSQTMSRTIVAGDNSADPREFDGIKRRANVLNKSLFHNSAGAGGAALSLTNLDIVNRSVNGITHWLFPYDLMAYMDAAARSPTLTNNAITQKADELGRTVTMYQGKPILYGYEPDDSPLLTDFNEVASGGGGAVTASIYGLSLRGDRTFLIEGASFSAIDEGVIPGQPWYSTHCKWDLGLVNQHPRGLARLTSVTKAAIVA
jgi:hypothetical protein